MKTIISDFLRDKINLEEFINVVSTNTLSINEETFDILNNYENIDKSSIAFLILYYIGKCKFSKENDFIFFLDSILDETDNDFSKDVIYIKKDVNEVIFRIDQVYFIINSSSLPTNIVLPKELQNNNHFCLNCNHELYFGESLHLDSFEFYLIECNI